MPPSVSPLRQPAELPRAGSSNWSVSMCLTQTSIVSFKPRLRANRGIGAFQTALRCFCKAPRVHGEPPFLFVALPSWQSQRLYLSAGGSSAGSAQFLPLPCAGNEGGSPQLWASGYIAIFRGSRTPPVQLVYFYAGRLKIYFSDGRAHRKNSRNHVKYRPKFNVIRPVCLHFPEPFP
ncbi:hypothetical protein AABM17_2148 [Neisseria musculi]|uniref:Uncharacterized protein n=1 Tax=Neisseria musculi TaxID=1815583 RepID=A0A7H1M8D0_9NEIS|nr:hypothetical protein H7A79_2147 [Neisseria musculi]